MIFDTARFFAPTFAVIFLTSLAAHADIIPIYDMTLTGEATVTASPCDIGSPDYLFDGEWGNLYRTDNYSNPAYITVRFTEPQQTAAARAKFSSPGPYEWSLEAADTLSDLSSKTGTWVQVFAPTSVPGDDTVQWTQWHDAPITRSIYRFRVYRTVVDNHVHICELELQSYADVYDVEVNGQTVPINTIELSPREAKFATTTTKNFTGEGSFYFGPDRYDVTDVLRWRSLTPSVAQSLGGGAFLGLAPGEGVISANVGRAIGRASVVVTEFRDVDLDVGFIHRTPEYQRFQVDHNGDQCIASYDRGTKRWPDAGETVTYTAHVFNKGDNPGENARYRWYFDGHVVDEGVIASIAPGDKAAVSYSAPWPADVVQTVDIPAGAQELDPQQCERAIGEHRIRFEIDPDDEIAESCENNNVVEDYINALAFWVYMDETTYAKFNGNENFIGSRSAEDWARAQLLGVVRRFRISGCPQKIRLAMLDVRPDGTLSPYTIHEPIGTESWHTDGRWGFQIQEYDDALISRYMKVNFNAVMHEWCHQMGLIDVYQYDIANENCLIERNGQLMVNSLLMPKCSSWNVYYGGYRLMQANGMTLIDRTNRGIMGTVATPYLGAGSAAGMNRNLGMRRGFFGDYLGAIPQGDIALSVRNADGTPVPNCSIRVFQREPDGIVHNSPKFTGFTDGEGRWVFPHQTLASWNGGMSVSNPWAWEDDYQRVRDTPNAIGSNAVLIAELSFNGVAEYHFIDVDVLNIAMSQGVLDDYDIPLVTYESRKYNQLPIISVQGCCYYQSMSESTVYVTEGEVFETPVSAIDYDGDPVTLRATPLYNSSFDPQTGVLRFQPDTLQVTESDGYSEEMFVDIVADDGKFVSTHRIWFRVSDNPNLVYFNELPVAVVGDLNCDGALNAFDIDPFVVALVDAETYGDHYAQCDIKMADCNGDGAINAFDIDPFVQRLVGAR